MGDESETETEATISLLQEGHNEAGRGASPQTVSKPTAKQDGPSKAGKASLKEVRP